MTRQPAVSIPCGFIDDPAIDQNIYMNPFPASLQIVGKMYSEPLLLRAAHAFQKATKHLENGLDFIRQQ